MKDKEVKKKRKTENEEVKKKTQEVLTDQAEHKKYIKERMVLPKKQPKKVVVNCVGMIAPITRNNPETILFLLN